MVRRLLGVEGWKSLLGCCCSLDLNIKLPTASHALQNPSLDPTDIHPPRPKYGFLRSSRKPPTSPPPNTSTHPPPLSLPTQTLTDLDDFLAPSQACILPVRQTNKVSGQEDGNNADVCTPPCASVPLKLMRDWCVIH